MLNNYTEEMFLYWQKWVNTFKKSDIPISFVWRRGDISNVGDILLHLANFRKDNIKLLKTKTII